MSVVQTGFSLEGFHALIAENTLLAKLETEGSVGPHDLLAGKEWCKRRLADDRVFVIPHHHQMAVDLSRPRRRPARGSFTVGVQGESEHKTDRISQLLLMHSNVGPTDGAKRPILLEFRYTENLVFGQKYMYIGVCPPAAPGPWGSGRSRAGPEKLRARCPGGHRRGAARGGGAGRPGFPTRFSRSTRGLFRNEAPERPGWARKWGSGQRVGWVGLRGRCNPLPGGARGRGRAHSVEEVSS